MKACTGSGDVGVELALGLAFELRLRQLDADHGDQALAHIVAGEILLQVLEQAERLAGGVDGARERGAEALQMRAAIDGVDVVGEGEDGFAVGVVVLQADFDDQAFLLHRLHVNGLFVEDVFALVEMLDELGDAAVEFEFAVLGIAGLGVGGALVGEGDDQSLVEEGELAQTVGQRVVVVLGDGEDGLVRNEVDLGAAPLGGAGLGRAWWWERLRNTPAPRWRRHGRSRVRAARRAR